MRDDLPGITGRAGDLRRAFDKAFAQPARGPSEAVENLLALRVGPDELAVRLGEIRALLPAPKIVSVPSAAPGLLGIAGLRGAIVPIYGLGILLGHAPIAEPSRFIILVSSPSPIGLAFEEFAGQFRVPRSEISGMATPTSRSHIREAASVAGTLRGIISVRSVMRSLAEQIADLGAIKEI